MTLDGAQQKIKKLGGANFSELISIFSTDVSGVEGLMSHTKDEFGLMRP